MQTPKIFGSLLLSAAALSLALPGLSAGDWPHWRGPQRNGISTEKDWLDRWPESGPKIAWNAEVGLGFSSMVVGEGRLFTAGHADGKDTVFAFDAATGKPLWNHAYPAELGDKYYEGGTTGTPTIDGNRLYWLSRWGDLFAFEAATGKILWNKNVQKETGLRIPDWGFTGAPLVHKNLLILNIGEAGLAVEKDTGKIAWKSADKDPGYSTPLPLPGPAPLVLIGSGQNYIAVNPDTGAEAWRVKWATQYGVNAPDPVLSGDRMLLSTGYGKGLGLFDLSQNPPKELLKGKALRTQMNPGVLHEGHVYGVDGDTSQTASLKCIEFATGQEKWNVPNFGSGGLIIASGKIIALSAKGELSVAPATPSGFTPTAQAQVMGGKIWTAPVLAHGRVYCRSSRGEIACVDLRAGSQASK